MVRKQGLFSDRSVQELLVNILPVLDYVHSQRIVHRDIKPDNIILRDRDRKPVLIDFGAVRESMGTVVNSQGSPTSSIIIGTPGYMPSEQAAGRPVYSSDLYSLGMTAIYLLTGKQPQDLETDPRTGETIWRTHALNVSPILATAIDRAIAYHPRDRFSTAREMLDALHSTAVNVPINQPETVKSASKPVNTVPVISTTTPSGSNLKGILLGSLIAGGLIGGSVVFGMVLTKTSQTQPKDGSAQVSPSPSVVVANTQPSVKPEKTSPPTPVKVVETTTPTTQNPADNTASSFYFLSDSAFSTRQSALNQIKRLQGTGYGSAGSFWTPNYPNLSNKQLFTVYAAQFSDRQSCIDLLKTYGKSNSQAYCAFASKDANAPADRVHFKDTSKPTDTTTASDYSWLSQRQVTDADLSGKDGFELDVIRNSIYARHGRRFNNSALQDYFNKQSWYRPEYSPDDFPVNLLSKIEQDNAKYIDEYQTRNNLRSVK